VTDAAAVSSRGSRNRKKEYHHEAHEEHEGKKIFRIRHPFRYPVFVSFAIFVVN
jgi:hypothetical protein